MARDASTWRCAVCGHRAQPCTPAAPDVREALARMIDPDALRETAWAHSVNGQFARLEAFRKADAILAHFTVVPCAQVKPDGE